MDQPAFTAFADVWPRATEREIGTSLCAIGAEGLTFFSSESEVCFRPSCLDFYLDTAL